MHSAIGRVTGKPEVMARPGSERSYEEYGKPFDQIVWLLDVQQKRKLMGFLSEGRAFSPVSQLCNSYRLLSVILLELEIDSNSQNVCTKSCPCLRSNIRREEIPHATLNTDKQATCVICGRARVIRGTDADNIVA